MKGMEIKTSGYPKSITFSTDMKLPPFICGCEVRTKILHSELLIQKVKTPLCKHTDYIVNAVEKSTKGELWFTRSQFKH